MTTAMVIALGILIMLPMKAFALDLGLTPDQVYSHWSNINKAILSISKLTSKDAELIGRIDAMEVRIFTGSTPGDILELALHIEEKFDSLRIIAGLHPTRKIQISGASTTPTDVYILSSRILLSAVEWIINHSDKRRLVTKYFERLEFQGKTPSGVYGLVDLADRRLHLVLSDGFIRLRAAKETQ
jgi:hypothetical protein